MIEMLFLLAGTTGGALLALLGWALWMLCRPQPARLPRITRCDKPDCWCEDWIPLP